MKKNILSVIILFTAILSGCNNKQTASIKLADDSGKIEINSGESFMIKLESNPTTGYLWNLAKPESDIIKKIDDVYKPAKTTGNVVGSGGTEEWTFKAIAKGETKLIFQYIRPWEKDKQPEKETIYTIIVK
jgi:inhibitor of cysteine peptidase